MNALELLKTDHRTVEALFAKVRSKPDASHTQLFKKIKGELDTHTHVEEKLLYPRLEENGNKELADVTREGIEEHLQIHRLLDELSALTGKRGQRDTFEAKLQVLMENVEHHASEEEDEMFSMIEDKYETSTLEKWGREMEKEKQKFQKKNGIVPVPPAKGAVARVIDAAVEAVSGVFSSQQSGERGKTTTAGKKNTNKANGTSAAKKTSTTSSSETKKSSKTSTKTSTAANGGKRSNPPRVSGNGKGEAAHSKGSEASKARNSSRSAAAGGSTSTAKRGSAGTRSSSR